MSTKRIIILCGLVVLLGLLAAWPYLKSRWQVTQPSSANSLLTLADFIETAVEEVVITKEGQETITLTKDKGSWQVNGFVASPSAVQGFFNDVGKVRSDTIVARNPATHEQFGLTPALSHMVSFTSEGREKTYLIGNFSAERNALYLKPNESNEVYAATGSGLKAYFSRSVTQWRNRVITTLTPDTLQKIEVVLPTTTVFLTKTADNTWEAKRSAAPVKLETAITQEILLAFNPLEATDFLSDQEKSEFNLLTSKRKIRLFTDSEKTAAELTIALKNDQWWVQVAGQEEMYTVEKHKLNTLLLENDTIFK